jgi:asparagine synthase (glutamine-hydrolysing)
MCGVLAAVTRRPLHPERRAEALVSLAHRGPDGSGQVTLEDGSVWLGHTRLAIIAVDDGRQPLASEDGSIHAVVGGEIYGFEAIRRELEDAGHRFSSRTDSEVLIHLYEERGLSFVDALRGEIAFVLWDAREKRLVAGRDRYGIKPLCYAEHEGSLYLASEAKGLFALGVPAVWDRESFLHAVTHQYLPPSRTLFAGVRQLPAGHLLVAERGAAPRLTRYWDLDLPLRAEEEREADDEALTHELRAALDDAVRTRLRADVPIAFALSGGLDSAAIAAISARESPRPIHTFGVTFDHPPYDEREAANAVARHIGAEHHEVHVGQDDLVDALPDAVAHGEGLAIDGQLPAKLLLACAIRDAGFRVVLTGEGADELLYGYPHLLSDLRDASPGLIAQQVERRLSHHDASRGVMLPSAGQDDEGLSALLDSTLGHVPTFFRAKAGIGRRLGSLLDGEAAAHLRARPPFVALLAEIDVEGQLRGRHPVAKSAYLWTRLALAGYILRTLGDGTEMAASIEGRPPFLDHPLAAVARRLPLRLKIRDGVEKHVLREATTGLLPERTRTKPKHPFLAPPLSLHPTPRTRALVHDVLTGRAIDAVPYVDRKRVASFLQNLDGAGVAERRAASPVVFTLLTACLLAAHFNLEDAR